MKTPSARWLTGLALCCIATFLSGCAPIGGAGRFPGGYVGSRPGGYPPISYLPNPGAPGCCYVGYPGTPSIPIVLNPTPPVKPPVTTPTIPVGLPESHVPNEKSLDYWSPWPLPPRGKPSSVSTPRPSLSGNSTTVDREYPEIAQSHGQYVLTSQRFGDNSRPYEEASAAGAEDLKYHGGRLIRDLYYVNLYVSGDTKWSRTDVEQIDSRLSAAMKDERLNNVLLQYFENQPIRSSALPSHPLVGYTPKTVTRGDIQNMISWLHRQGFLKSFDLKNTVFNLLLPAGTLLTVEDRASIAVSDEVVDSAAGHLSGAVPPSEEGDSLAGLAGYHGSVVTASNDRVYYTVSVYSQRGANATTNGIPVFTDSWKNVVATLYHQLAESRTNPDVEEAMRQASDGSGEKYLGWVSASGLEVGDFPIRTNIPLNKVFREVAIANGSGVVPVQLLYSNASHGPEGPIAQPHTLP